MAQRKPDEDDPNAPDAGMLDRSPTTSPAYPMPEYGKLRGKKVLLKDVTHRLSQKDLEDVEVEVPGVGTVRPWHFASDRVEVRDGVLTIC